MSSDWRVWFYPMSGWWEEAIDLFTCRRLDVSAFGLLPEDHPLAYYLTKAGRWIQHAGRPSIEGGPVTYPEGFREVAPQTVVHRLTQLELPFECWPPELEKFSKFRGRAEYAKWLKETTVKTKGLVARQKFDRPIWQNRCLMFGNRVCKSFGRDAPNQMKLLDAFQEANWDEQVKDPFSNPSRLKDTVVAMNKWPGSPIAFTQKGQVACWYPRPPKPKSSSSS